MEIYADIAEGYMNITTSGGNGNRGQFGAPGIRGTDRTSQVQRRVSCSSVVEHPKY